MVNIEKANWNMAIEIVDLPIKNDDCLTYSSYWKYPHLFHRKIVDLPIQNGGFR